MINIELYSTKIEKKSSSRKPHYPNYLDICAFRLQHCEVDLMFCLLRVIMISLCDDKSKGNSVCSKCYYGSLMVPFFIARRNKALSLFCLQLFTKNYTLESLCFYAEI